MEGQDTVRLLRECDAGIKMGVDSIDDVLGYVGDVRLKQRLVDCKDEHIRLKDEVQGLLGERHDTGKDPSPVAKGMSWLKTNVKLVLNESDGTIAGIMTDGCDMGVKSLSKYLNQYQAADEQAKDVAKKLIGLEEDLAADLRGYL